MPAPGRPALTVTLIARDEEDRLPARSRRWRSPTRSSSSWTPRTTDRTAEIARAAGARVLVRAFDGFGPQKNAAAALATHRWILSIDADEIVSPALAVEIRARLAATVSRELAARGLPRSRSASSSSAASSASGATRSCGPRASTIATRARFSDDPVHEKILANGPVESLDESILHRSYRDLAHYLEKLDRYTTLAAEAKWAAGKGGGGFLPVRVSSGSSSTARSCASASSTARPGLTFAALSSANTLLKYLKLRELESAIARGERRRRERARRGHAALLRSARFRPVTPVNGALAAVASGGRPRSASRCGSTGGARGGPARRS